MGGGASGLIAAAYIQNNAHNTSYVILEKEPRVGKRLLSTGNGRCNLTNSNISQHNYRGTGSKYIADIISKYNTNFIIKQLNTLGLLTREDQSGRVYPYCEQASSVLDVLRKYTFEHELTEFEVVNIEKQNNLFAVKSKNEQIKAKKIIIACGGFVSPKLGANGSGYDIAKALGHKIISPLPSLAPVPVNSKILSSLKGIRSICNVTLYHNGQAIKSENGEIQFADGALSGICIFQLSPYVNRLLSKKEKNIYISVNFMPEFNREQIINLIKDKITIDPKQTLENFFVGILNKRIGQAVFKTADILPLSRQCGELSQVEIKKLSKTICDMRFTPSSISDKNKAQVSIGGIDCNEIDMSTMQSKKIKGLYFAGEITDVDGDCGGYNLHYAFSTGLIAAKNSIKDLNK